MSDDDLSEWLVCDEHARAYHISSFCPWCRVEELQAKAEELTKRCYPSKVFTIGDTGHYVSEAVYNYMVSLQAKVEELETGIANHIESAEGYEDRIEELEKQLKDAMSIEGFRDE